MTPYRMVGIPDGLGAFDNYDGTFTALMNHELRLEQGIARLHGFTGAFVSHWIVRKSDLGLCCTAATKLSRCSSGKRANLSPPRSRSRGYAGRSTDTIRALQSQ